MNRFEQAAKAMGADIVAARKAGALLSAEMATEMIIDKFAQLAEEHAALCELADMVPHLLEQYITMIEQMYGRDEEGGVSITEFVSVIRNKYNSPAIKRAMERKP